MSWPCPHRRRRLLELHSKGLTFKEIAAEYGGTPQGVRSTIRKLLERDDPLEMPRTRASQHAERIRQLREIGLYQHEIAERVGLSRYTVWRVLNG